MEDTLPEIWPGSEPWTDSWGSFGTIPDSQGFGSTVERTRVPPARLPQFWDDIQHRYGASRPRFRIGPNDTPGLAKWLTEMGYRCETHNTVLVMDLPVPHYLIDGPPPNAREVTTIAELNQVIHLDHLVFNDPILDDEGLHQELRRLGTRRRLFFIPGEGKMALAAGGVSCFTRWALLWGGETHPQNRNQGLYHQILKARLQLLESHETDFVAVIADDSTSMPILKHLGFQGIGQSTVWAPTPNIP